MSQRTIVEFNNDYAHEIERHGEAFVAILKTALASGDDRHWEALKAFGITKGFQCHHSTKRWCAMEGYASDGFQKHF